MSIPLRLRGYARAHADFVRGARLLLPVLPVYRRGYNVHADEVQTGWWWFAISFAAERLGRPAHGLSVRLDWGWIKA